MDPEKVQVIHDWPDLTLGNNYIDFSSVAAPLQPLASACSQFMWNKELNQRLI